MTRRDGTWRTIGRAGPGGLSAGSGSRGLSVLPGARTDFAAAGPDDGAGLRLASPSRFATGACLSFLPGRRSACARVPADADFEAGFAARSGSLDWLFPRGVLDG